jgi:ABC-2 type transport system ATP-binding protein
MFGRKAAVNDISLEIPRGEIVTFLGPNGAGKSTTINMMLGILPPSRGLISVEGKNPQFHQNRQCIGAMLQHIGLPDTLKPLEMLQMWQSYYHKPLPVDQVIEITGLSDIARNKFGNLSGGQRRRVAFALAICGNPDILFLDEPSAGLDIQARGLLWKEIRNFASLKKTIVLCTHYLDEADALSTRIVLMDKGEIIADDTPCNIKAKVNTKTVAFKSLSPISVFEGLPFVEKVVMHSNLISIETNSPESLLKKIFELDICITDLEVNSVSLESAFLALTKSNQQL